MDKQRNITVDILRGIAMLMVVLGHTLTGVTSDASNSLLFNIIWSLQMPLFILISGYVVKYRKRISTAKELWHDIKKRTIAYLFPWIMWMFLVRGVVFKESYFLDIKYILWHMDSGYWFLFTIWVISVIFALSDFIANKILNPSAKIKNAILKLFCYLVFMALLVLIGYKFGLSFLGMKLTLYYMPFYFAGYLYGQFDEKIKSFKFGSITIEVIVATCLIAWFVLLMRFNLYNIDESVFGIGLRVIISLCGCIAICGLVSEFIVLKDFIYKDKIAWFGTHSLEIYLTHYKVLNLVKPTNCYGIASIEGVMYSLVNFCITMILAVVVIKLLNSNRYTKAVLFCK